MTNNNNLIANYSDDKEYCLLVRQNNYSDVFSKLITLTAKLTEQYASDMFYTMLDINHCLVARKSFNFLIGFRDYGVDLHNISGAEMIEKLDIEFIKAREYNQIWQIKANYENEREPITLRRVTLQ